MFSEILKLGIITLLFLNLLETKPTLITAGQFFCLTRNLKKCVKEIVFKFLHKFDYFSGNQYHFLQGKGTNDAFFDHISHVAKILVADRSTATVYFDLHKAFDTVNYNNSYYYLV